MVNGLGIRLQEQRQLNILVRRSRRSGVARATIPDLGSHHLLLI